MNKTKKIVLSVFGGIYAELILLLIIGFCNKNVLGDFSYKIGYSFGDENYLLFALYIIISIIPFIVGFIVSYKLSNKELKAQKKYNNNFIITIIRIILASLFTLFFFFENTILEKVITIFIVLSILPITYRTIKNKLNISIPKWVQIVLPIILFIIVASCS